MALAESSAGLPKGAITLRVLAQLADFERILAPVVFVSTRDVAEKDGGLLEHFATALLGASETLTGDTGRDEFIRVGQEGPLKGETVDLAGSIYDYYRSVGL